MKIMKHTYLFLVLLFVVSCSNNLDLEEEDDIYENATTSTRSNFPPGEWESWDNVKLVNLSSPVSVPWNPQMTSTAIPDDIRFDIKREDGWDLLVETISRQESKMNYIVFYNRYTGILKGFYYLETASEGNNAFWQIGFENQRQKLLYNQDGFFTYPHSLEQNISDISIMNVTNNKTRGFTEGWNCFLLELTYDPNQAKDLILSITSYQQNIGSIELAGNFSSQSSGTIISSAVTAHSNDFGIFNKANIKTMQDDAKNWLIKNISIGSDKKPIKNVAADAITSILNGGIKAAVTSGVGYVFSSFLGGQTSTPNNYTLQLNTTGEVKLTGKTENPRTTAIPPLKITLPNKPYGIWNLSESPTISVGRWAKVLNPRWNNNRVQYEYRIEKKNISDESLILISPGIRPFLKNYTVTFCYSSGHLEHEIYNLHSSSRNEVIEKFNNRLDLRLLGKAAEYLPIIRYENENIIKQPANLGDKNLVYRTHPTVNLVPKHKSYLDNASPYLDIKEAGFETEDIKVLFTYTVSIYGVSKTFYSIRSYDPELIYHNNAGGCVPHRWTPTEVVEYFNN